MKIVNTAFILGFVTTSALAHAQKVSDSTQSTEDGESRELRKCITKDEVNGVIQAFADAVPTISTAYWDNGGGKSGKAKKKACKKAYKQANLALDGAYGYDDVVLFKPTLTAEPYTYRPTRNGALSYFIGTECLMMVGKTSEQFPDENMDETVFMENGFALNNFNGGKGWTFDTEWDSEDWYYRIGGQNCETAVAIGQMCFTHVKGKRKTCVDKTFGFNRKNGSVLLTSHHSSSVIPSEDSLVICQEKGRGVPKC